MNKHLYDYLEYCQKPWGQIFYKCIWAQLPQLSGKAILDFGSGFSITAEHYSHNNAVVALEPSEDMIKLSESINTFIPQNGGIERLREYPDNYFDVILCHNVLEYVEDRAELLSEFNRVLKPDGFISIVKHNKNGKIMAKAVSEYDIESAVKMLDNENLTSQKFGEIRMYSNNDLLAYSNGTLEITKCLALCTFWHLQSNEIKYNDDWMPAMLNLELKVCDIDDFKSVSRFHHIILNKV